MFLFSLYDLSNNGYINTHCFGKINIPYIILVVLFLALHNCKTIHANNMQVRGILNAHA